MFSIIKIYYHSIGIGVFDNILNTFLDYSIKYQLFLSFYFPYLPIGFKLNRENPCLINSGYFLLNGFV